MKNKNYEIAWKMLFTKGSAFNIFLDLNAKTS